MNFLEICKRARKEARITGDGPASVVNQTGILSDVVSAVQDAWLEIQMTHETWRFLGKIVDKTLSVDVSTYYMGDFAINDFARFNQILVEGKTLTRIPWDEFVFYERANPIAERGVPRYYSLAQDNQLHISPVPDKAYNITFDYYRKPIPLLNNTDTPIIPDQFHMMVVWRAVMDLAANESDTVIYQKAFDKYDNFLARLERDMLPRISLGGSTFS